MNTTKTLLSAAGWLLALLMACEAHAADNIQWYRVIDHKVLERMPEGEATFTIGRTQCLLTDSSDDVIGSSRSIVCWRGKVAPVIVAQATVVCTRNQAEPTYSPIMRVEGRAVQLACL